MDLQHNGARATLERWQRSKARAVESADALGG